MQPNEMQSNGIHLELSSYRKLFLSLNRYKNVRQTQRQVQASTSTISYPPSMTTNCALRAPMVISCLPAPKIAIKNAVHATKVAGRWDCFWGMQKRTWCRYTAGCDSNQLILRVTARRHPTRSCSEQAPRAAHRVVREMDSYIGDVRIPTGGKRRKQRA